MNTPVVLIIFNRPDLTAQVLASIKHARPRQLFVVADAPRPTHPEDQRLCAETRALVEQIDWDCEVLRNYADTNMGCAHRVASGLSWVFEHVERAIILEDDCLPEASFYQFCEELLERYRDDERVMMISGNNFLLGQYEVPHSYFFHTYTGMWGWATWRRAWRHHDLAIRHWPQLRNTSWLADILPDPRAVRYWHAVFESAYASAGDFDTWDAQWYFALWSQHGLAAAPRVNLVTNIGFRPDATHTKGKGRLGDLPASALTWPLSHPEQVLRDRDADLTSLTHALSLQPETSTRYQRLRRRAARMLPAPIRSAVLEWRQSIRSSTSLAFLLLNDLSNYKELAAFEWATLLR
jgi:hypothetical protein